MLHFEPSLDALSLRSDVINSIKILFQAHERSCRAAGYQGILSGCATEVDSKTSLPTSLQTAYSAGLYG